MFTYIPGVQSLPVLLASGKVVPIQKCDKLKFPSFMADEAEFVDFYAVLGINIDSTQACIQRPTSPSFCSLIIHHLRSAFLSKNIHIRLLRLRFGKPF